MATMTLSARTGAERCGASVTGGVLDHEAAERLARSFQALADPARVRLLSLIAAADDGEACICDLIEPLGLSQPTVSHHMRRLVEAGLVTREQRGRWAYYSVVDEALTALSATLGGHPRSEHEPGGPVEAEVSP